jgi:hypothetical protein
LIEWKNIKRSVFREDKMMNESYFQSVIADRQRDVAKIVKDGQDSNQLSDAGSNQDDSHGKAETISTWSVLLIGKRLMSVLLSRISTA